MSWCNCYWYQQAHTPVKKSVYESERKNNERKRPSKNVD